MGGKPPLDLLTPNRGCAVWDAAEGLTWVGDGGAVVAHVDGISSLAADGDGVLVATGEGPVRLDPTGASQPVATGGAKATAATRLGDGFAVGFMDGTIRRIPARGGPEVPDISFESPPDNLASGDPVSVLTPGPAGTLVAAYTAGLVGVWDTRQGVLLRYELFTARPSTG